MEKKEGEKMGRWEGLEVGSGNAEVGKKEDEKVRKKEGGKEGSRKWECGR